MGLFDSNYVYNTLLKNKPMKNLLIILLLFAGINCQAQTITDTIFVADEFGIITDTLVYVTGENIKYWPEVIEEYHPSAYEIYFTLGDWFDYEKECYNDSTLQLVSGEVFRFYDPSLNIPPSEQWRYQLKQDSIIYHYEFVHKIKPTLEGFIEYMKRQMK